MMSKRSRYLKIRDLPSKCRESELRSAFERYAGFQNVRFLSKDARTRQAILSFEDVKSANNVLSHSAAHNIKVNNQSVKLDYHEPLGPAVSQVNNCTTSPPPQSSSLLLDSLQQHHGHSNYSLTGIINNKKSTAAAISSANCNTHTMTSSSTSSYHQSMLESVIAGEKFNNSHEDYHHQRTNDSSLWMRKMSSSSSTSSTVNSLPSPVKSLPLSSHNSLSPPRGRRLALKIHNLPSTLSDHALTRSLTSELRQRHGLRARQVHTFGSGDRRSVLVYFRKNEEADTAWRTLQAVKPCPVLLSAPVSVELFNVPASARGADDSITTYDADQFNSTDAISPVAKSSATTATPLRSPSIRSVSSSDPSRASFLTDPSHRSVKSPTRTLYVSWSPPSSNNSSTTLSRPMCTQTLSKAFKRFGELCEIELDTRECGAFLQFLDSRSTVRAMAAHRKKPLTIRGLGLALYYVPSRPSSQAVWLSGDQLPLVGSGSELDLFHRLSSCVPIQEILIIGRIDDEDNTANSGTGRDSRHDKPYSFVHIYVRLFAQPDAVKLLYALRLGKLIDRFLQQRSIANRNVPSKSTPLIIDFPGPLQVQIVKLLHSKEAKKSPVTVDGSFMRRTCSSGHLIASCLEPLSRNGCPPPSSSSSVVKNNASSKRLSSTFSDRSWVNLPSTTTTNSTSVDKRPPSHRHRSRLVAGRAEIEGGRPAAVNNNSSSSSSDDDSSDSVSVSSVSSASLSTSSDSSRSPSPKPTRTKPSSFSFDSKQQSARANNFVASPSLSIKSDQPLLSSSSCSTSSTITDKQLTNHHRRPTNQTPVSAPPLTTVNNNEFLLFDDPLRSGDDWSSQPPVIYESMYDKIKRRTNKGTEQRRQLRVDDDDAVKRRGKKQIGSDRRRRRRKTVDSCHVDGTSCCSSGTETSRINDAESVSRRRRSMSKSRRHDVKHQSSQLNGSWSVAAPMSVPSSSCTNSTTSSNFTSSNKSRVKSTATYNKVRRQQQSSSSGSDLDNEDEDSKSPPETLTRFSLGMRFNVSASYHKCIRPEKRSTHVTDQTTSVPFDDDDALSQISSSLSCSTTTSSLNNKRQASKSRLKSDSSKTSTTSSAKRLSSVVEVKSRSPHVVDKQQPHLSHCPSPIGVVVKSDNASLSSLTESSSKRLHVTVSAKKQLADLPFHDSRSSSSLTKRRAGGSKRKRSTDSNTGQSSHYQQRESKRPALHDSLVPSGRHHFVKHPLLANSPAGSCEAESDVKRRPVVSAGSSTSSSRRKRFHRTSSSSSTESSSNVLVGGGISSRRHRYRASYKKAAAAWTCVKPTADDSDRLSTASTGSTQPMEQDQCDLRHATDNTGIKFSSDDDEDIDADDEWQSSSAALSSSPLHSIASAPRLEVPRDESEVKREVKPEPSCSAFSTDQQVSPTVSPLINKVSTVCSPATNHLATLDVLPSSISVNSASPFTTATTTTFPSTIASCNSVTYSSSSRHRVNSGCGDGLKNMSISPNPVFSPVHLSNIHPISSTDTTTNRNVFVFGSDPQQHSPICNTSNLTANSLESNTGRSVVVLPSTSSTVIPTDALLQQTIAKSLMHHRVEPNKLDPRSSSTTSSLLPSMTRPVMLDESSRSRLTSPTHASADKTASTNGPLIVHSTIVGPAQQRPGEVNHDIERYVQSVIERVKAEKGEQIQSSSTTSATTTNATITTSITSPNRIVTPGNVLLSPITTSANTPPVTNNNNRRILHSTHLPVSNATSTSILPSLPQKKPLLITSSSNTIVPTTGTATISSQPNSVGSSFKPSQDTTCIASSSSVITTSAPSSFLMASGGSDFQMPCIPGVNACAPVTVANVANQSPVVAVTTTSSTSVVPPLPPPPPLQPSGRITRAAAAAAAAASQTLPSTTTISSTSTSATNTVKTSSATPGRRHRRSESRSTTASSSTNTNSSNAPPHSTSIAAIKVVPTSTATQPQPPDNTILALPVELSQQPPQHRTRGRIAKSSTINCQSPVPPPITATTTIDPYEPNFDDDSPPVGLEHGHHKVAIPPVVPTSCTQAPLPPLASSPIRSSSSSCCSPHLRKTPTSFSSSTNTTGNNAAAALTTSSTINTSSSITSPSSSPSCPSPIVSSSVVGNATTTAPVANSVTTTAAVTPTTTALSPSVTSMPDTAPVTIASPDNSVDQVIRAVSSGQFDVQSYINCWRQDGSGGGQQPTPTTSASSIQQILSSSNVVKSTGLPFPLNLTNEPLVAAVTIPVNNKTGQNPSSTGALAGGASATTNQSVKSEGDNPAATANTGNPLLNTLLAALQLIPGSQVTVTGPGTANASGGGNGSGGVLPPGAAISATTITLPVMAARQAAENIKAVLSASVNNNNQSSSENNKSAVKLFNNDQQQQKACNVVQSKACELPSIPATSSLVSAPTSSLTNPSLISPTAFPTVASQQRLPTTNVPPSIADLVNKQIVGNTAPPFLLAAGGKQRHQTSTRLPVPQQPLANSFSPSTIHPVSTTTTTNNTNLLMMQQDPTRFVTPASLQQQLRGLQLPIQQQSIPRLPLPNNVLPQQQQRPVSSNNNSVGRNSNLLTTLQAAFPNLPPSIQQLLLEGAGSADQSALLSSLLAATMPLSNGSASTMPVKDNCQLPTVDYMKCFNQLVDMQQQKQSPPPLLVNQLGGRLQQQPATVFNSAANKLASSSSSQLVDNILLRSSPGAGGNRIGSPSSMGIIPSTSISPPNVGGVVNTSNRPPNVTTPSSAPARNTNSGNTPSLINFAPNNLGNPYPFVWEGQLSLKNIETRISLHYLHGNADLLHTCINFLVRGGGGQSQQALAAGGPLRIVQRMRLEPVQLEGVRRKMLHEGDSCACLALPVGVDQSRVLHDAFIQYMLEKTAAGIINVGDPGVEQQQQQQLWDWTLEPLEHVHRANSTAGRR